MNDTSSPANRQWWLISLLALGALIVGGLAVKRAVNGNADLSGNYYWWRVNLTQSTLPERREGLEKQDPDSYPPITYAIHAPLGALPLWLTASLWYLQNLACTAYLIYEARRWLAESHGWPQFWWPRLSPLSGELLARQIVPLAVLCVLPAWLGSLLLGQNTLLLMCLTWGAYRAFDQGHPWRAGILLGIATTLKVLPAVFMLPFLIQPKLRIWIAFVLTGIVLAGGLGSAYFGPQTNFDFHHRWLIFALRGPEQRAADPRDPNSLRGSLRFHNQSLEIVLARLLTDVPIYNQPDAPRVNVLNVSAENWRRVRSIATGLCLVLGVTALTRRRWPGSPSQGTTDSSHADRQLETYATVAMLPLFVSPVVWSHYYLWLFHPLLWILTSAVRGRLSGFAVTVMWLLTLPFLGAEIPRAIGLHLWASLILFVWICWPQLPGYRRRDAAPVAV